MKSEWNTAIARRKEELIQKILENPTYLPESGLVRKLVKALGKMSLSDLSGLDVVVRMKCADPLGGGAPVSDYADVMTLASFIEDCNWGSFVDNDGMGYYSDGKNEWTRLQARPSEIKRGIIDRRFSHVAWYNK